MSWKTIAACLAIACTGIPAAAQVHRCKDSAGRTIYSDAACLAGQSGVLVERQKSREEILQERLQAAEANERKYRLQAVELESQASISTSTPTAQQSVQQDRSSSYECRQAQRDHETVSSIRTGTTEERRNRINSSTIKVNTVCGMQTEMIQPPPRFAAPARSAGGGALITHCDQGFCHDNQGGVYHRNGPNFLTGPGGQTCHRAGAMWNCN